jgi:hypothetical protein
MIAPGATSPRSMAGVRASLNNAADATARINAIPSPFRTRRRERTAGDH